MPNGGSSVSRLVADAGLSVWVAIATCLSRRLVRRRCRTGYSLTKAWSRLRARHAPANNATLNNIALAIVFHRGLRHVPEANLHFMMRREDALDAILSPT